MEKESGKTPDEDKASASKERLSEVGKAHENELEVMNAAKEKELADQKAENAALKSQFEKALQAQQTENDNLKRSTTELLKECKGFEADILAKGAEIERFKTQMAEQEKSHIIASGKEEIEALKDQVSALEKQLKEVYDENLKKMERMAVEKDQIELLKARITEQDLMKNEANTVLKAQLEKALADSEASAKDKDKAEKENEELLKKLAKFEKDMAVGAEVCNAHSLSNCSVW